MDYDDMDDTHLCIKCSATIIGMDNYIEHRKMNCGRNSSNVTNHQRAIEPSSEGATAKNRRSQKRRPLRHMIMGNSSSISSANNTTTTTTTSTPKSVHIMEVDGAFPFTEPEPPSSYVSKNVAADVAAAAAAAAAASHEDDVPSTSGKSSHTKTFTDPYDIPYELDADLFFSSLQLQSVQSVPTQAHTGGKTTSTLSSSGTAIAHHTRASTSRQCSNETTLMQVVGKKYYDEVYNPMDYDRDSPEITSGDDLDLVIETDDIEAEAEGGGAVEGEVDVVDDGVEDVIEDAGEEDGLEDGADDDHDEDDDLDDEDYDPHVDIDDTSPQNKWKLAMLRNQSSMLSMPDTHTGGKWAPDGTPSTATITIARLSPSWDDPADDQHPPDGHTKGKWVPGTKLQHLEYKSEVALAKTTTEEYWCNICCRKLKSKPIYEMHLKSNYHHKRTEPEQQLEKATLDDLRLGEDLSKSLLELLEEPSIEQPRVCTSPNGGPTKRLRSRKFIKCDLCKHTIRRQNVGKHLISHYHYRRMRIHPEKSLHMIFDHIHSICLQAPYQCRPCRFYANTEDTFLAHWNSASHLDISEGPGKFWCNYCQYECEDNNQMRRHLLGPEHKEVILTIDRSVPICISKKLDLSCNRCHAIFRYNVALRRHISLVHPGMELPDTVSDKYQNRVQCQICADYFHSQVTLQRHEKNAHSVTRYYCAICTMEFGTPCQARQHCKTMEHRRQAAATSSTASSLEASGLLLKEKKDLDRLRALKMKSLKKSKGSDKWRKCKICNFVAFTFWEASKHARMHRKLSCNKKKVLENKIETNKMPNNDPKISEQSTMYHTLQKKKQRPQRCSKVTSFKCKDCGDVLTSMEELKLHRDAKHPQMRHVCHCCGETFALPQSLGRHSRVCQPQVIVAQGSKKSNTNETSIDPNEMVTASVIVDTKTWPCNECNFSASYQAELIYHRLFHTHGTSSLASKNATLPCPICAKSFRKRSLRYHLYKHTDERLFECKYCKSKFTQPHNLKDHIHNIHSQEETGDQSTAKDTTTASATIIDGGGRRRYPCDTCEKTYSTNHSLKKHKLTHSSAAEQCTFECTVDGCRYSTTVQSLLRTHMATHSEGQFKCEHKNCNYIGKSQLHLRRHRKSHFPSNAASTTESTATTKKEHSIRLRRYEDTHENKKSYKCPHCDYKCSCKENLRKHVLNGNIHPGKFMYECDLCSIEAKRKGTIDSSIMETSGQQPKDVIFKTNSYRQYQYHLTRDHNHK